ncbi:oligosaccharide flippase family protein [Colwellia psychrerythraea]|uniref:Polysaccharide biosynthesis protein n=1 Tax=Colwellia psychrerythraea (strain 34H / ATCC BAA-681) TaxID=167879 RepID=Q489D2_COLP3|nr:oligosaccharide flippase family protein [Colwellia psychrerythraea]AAZ25838.1 polysaccharide biosynthesis protein [Colwellia psychrerythraea 34H]
MNIDIKRLVDNFCSLAVLKIFNLLLPLVTLPYLLKTLELNNYGVIVLALSLIMYFQTITEYGFNLSATREIAKNRSSAARLEFIYSKVVWCKLLLLIISLLVLVVVVFFTPKLFESKTTFLLTGLILIGHSMFPEWFFRGMEQMRYITLLDLCIKLLFTIGVFVFINNEGDGWLYPLLLGSAYITVSILSHLLIYYKFNVSLKLVKFMVIYRTLKNTFPLFINQFFPNLYNNTTTFLVGMMLGNHAVGLFGAIKQVASLLNVFNSVITAVIFPYLNRNKDKFNLYCKYYLLLLFTVSLLFIFVGQYVFLLLEINDEIVNKVFLILIIGIFNIGIYSVFATNYLIIHKKDKLVMKITVITSLIGFSLSYPFIHLFGLTGAALTVCTSQFLLGTISFVFYKKNNERNI